MAKKTCYYELLGADRKCDAGEIKTLYRKLALQFHPDKAGVNNMSVEEATRKFQQVQEAYSCLSDPQERAWYDAHREQILKGDDEPGEDPFKTKINLYKYFAAGCYSGFGDDEGGFFSVYGSLFQSVDNEEEEWEDADEEHVVMPPFGNSSSEYSDVASFYRNWLEFCSRKAFGHADKWNPKDAPNRQTRRAMEQENKKARQTAKKEFNGEVRQIVQVVQRRDPRVAQHRKQQLKEAAEKGQREAAEKEAKKVAEVKDRQERKDAARREEEERWAEMQAEKEARKRRGEDISEDGDSSNESEEALGFVCEPCRKSFKSEAAFDQHAKSKKHLQIVAQLRKQLEKELRETAKQEVEEESESDDDEEEESEEDATKAEAPFRGFFPAHAELSEMKASELRKKASDLAADEEELEEADDAEDSKAALIELILRIQASPRLAGEGSKAKARPKPKALTQKQKLGLEPMNARGGASSSESGSDDDDDDAFLKRFAAARGQRGQAASAPAENFEPPSRTEAGEAASSNSSAGEGEGGARSATTSPEAEGSKKAQKRAKQKALLLEKLQEKEKVQELISGVRQAQRSEARENDDCVVGEPAEEAPPPAAASRKAKGSAAPKAGAAESTAAAASAETRCAVCNEEFPSRSKLFDHIKKTGHAALKEAAEPEPAKKGGKKNFKQKK